ncbi:bifunctional enoyl-CoA hydratase/phosphate acetyltransferase [Verminephrobacter eiseniae]|uniref:bifunctional enoyl-CoA hydratase/phosphate acetyltransferase n=1 Tax=Verminephrobacter eiseniae TaxID=364317 RepID=UPI00223876E1|nr:bifunctional enoyl-CoA hydratase/phosphate acetyltransferase [Verminephrobacter eiseniae]
MSEPQPGAPMAVQGAHRPAVANIRVPAALAHSHVVPVQHPPAALAQHLPTALAQPPPAALAQYPHLQALVQRGRERARCALPRLGLVYPCDAPAMHAATRIASERLAQPLLIGPRSAILAAADAAGVDAAGFEIVDCGPGATGAAHRAVTMARAGALGGLMKGSLHTDELMSAVLQRDGGLRGARRISHLFLFDLPRYPKLLGMADCVVNIAPDLPAKRDILGNAIELLRGLGLDAPKVGIVAAVESVNPAIAATLDAQALVAMGHAGAWPGALVEGPFGFDNVISAEAAQLKRIESRVSGDADLLLVPDLNAGNMLYKSFIYIGGGECAGLVLGAKVPVVLTSRADSLAARIASVALAVLAA